MGKKSTRLSNLLGTSYPVSLFDVDSSFLKSCKPLLLAEFKGVAVVVMPEVKLII